MKRRTLSLFILVFLFFTNVTGQQKSAVDSLSRLLENPKVQDTARVNLLIESAKAYLKRNLDTAFIQFSKAQDLAQKINYTNGIINGINGIGICYWYQNKPELTIKTFHQALALAQKAKNNTLQTKVAGNLGSYFSVLGITDSAMYFHLMAVNTGKDIPEKNIYAKALSDLGMIYYNRGKYMEAIEKYIEANNQFEASKSYRDLTISYIKLGMFYYDFHDFNKSATYYRKALIANKLHNDISLEPDILQNLGLLYFEIKKDYDSAAILLNKALKMAMMNGNKDVELFAKSNLGNISYEKKDYPTAIRYYLGVMESPFFNSRNKLKAAVLTTLGGAFFHVGDIEKARRYTQDGLQLSEQQNYVLYQKSAYKTLSDIAARQKDYKTAYDNAIRYATLQDTLGNTEVRRKVAEAMFTNALQQKENENLLLQKDIKIKHKTIRNQQLFIVIAAIILVLGSLLFLVIVRNNRKQRAMNQVLDQKNKELQELNQTKAKLYSVIAHDLRSPFSALLGILTELDENYEKYDEEAKHKMVNSLKRSSHNAFNLLVNLLDWTRFQRDNIEVHPAEINIKGIIREVLVILLSRAEAKNQSLNDESDESLQIYTDPDILKSVLLNLTNNAIKFSRNGGVVTVRASRQNHDIRFEVADTGIGIPQEEIAGLFKIDMKFQRLGTAKEPGTGLGLLMCKEFVGLLGGEIGVESKPDVGSVFWFTIPHNISHQNSEDTVSS